MRYTGTVPSSVSTVGGSPRSFWPRRYDCMRPLALLLLLACPLPAAGQAGDEDCTQTGASTVRCLIPLAEDTLLFLENRGVTRILVDLNGYRFKLASDPAEVARSRNAFPIPREGRLTLHIGAYMRGGVDSNVVSFLTQGPAGADWRFVIAPTFVEDQAVVAYAIGGLEPFPDRLSLLHVHPNPFRDRTQLTVDIPEGRLTGVPVRLAVYDLLGREVRVLAEGVRFPGRFVEEWDGRDGAGRPVSAGPYVARLAAGGQRYALRLTRL